MIRTGIAVGLALAVAGCGGDYEAEDAQDAAPEAATAEPDAAAAEPASVSITEPADGAEVDAGPLRVVMATTGIEIVAAGTMDAGTGHHHLIVDGEVDWTLPIPNDPGVHYHMGLAETEFTLEDLPPGQHRIIAVVADGVHVPLDPPVADTIHVTVR